MEIGQKVALYSHNVFYRFLTIERIAAFQGAKLELKFCYETNEGSAFDMNPDPETGHRFNVGNRAFWISEIELRR